MRRETLDSIEYLQVSDGLEILVSLESRLTFNIRCESADEFGEVHRDFTVAADWPRFPFLLTRRLSGTAENLYGGELLRRETPPHTHLLPTCPFLFPHLSVNRGRPLTAVPRRGVASAFRAVPAVSPLLRFFPAGSNGRAVHLFVALGPGSYR